MRKNCDVQQRCGFSETCNIKHKTPDQCLIGKTLRSGVKLTRIRLAGNVRPDGTLIDYP